MQLKQFMASVSASQINMYLADPGYWAATRLKGVYLPAGPEAQRGSCVELGLLEGLIDTALTVDEMTDIAVTQYNTIYPANTLNIGNTAADKQREYIKPMISHAIGPLRDLGPVDVPDTFVRQYEVSAPGPEEVGLPFRGFIDFCFPQAGVIVDLKTTTRLPSRVTAAHARQMALYTHACPGYTVDVLYASPNSASMLTMTAAQLETGWAECWYTVIKMNRMLAHFETVAHLVDVLTPNTSSFYWRTPEAQDVLHKTYPGYAV